MKMPRFYRDETKVELGNDTRPQLWVFTHLSSYTNTIPCHAGSWVTRNRWV